MMREFAHIVDGKVINRAIFDNDGLPNDWPDADQWVEASEDMQVGATFDGERFVLPEQEKPDDATIPSRPTVAKSLVIARLIATDKISAARAALDSDDAAYARWYAPDKPVVYCDDPEAVALVTAIGADPDEILAPLATSIPSL